MTDSDKLSHQPLRDLVAERLKEMIVAQELLPGERLIEDRLAERLGVSRNPVREAIRSLEAIGFVDVVPRKGAYVAQLDGDDAVYIQEIRAVLESYAADRAAALRTDDDIALLDSCIEQGRRAAAAGDSAGAARFHREFHIAVEEMSGNPYVVGVMEPLRQMTDIAFAVLLFRQRAEVSWQEHLAIRDAIASGDRNLARKLVVEHITGALDDLRGPPAASPPRRRTHPVRASDGDR